jgi:phosphohistidine phosphatase
MAKTLLLLRHAKSSYDDATLADLERPLNRRGKKAAARMGRLLRDEGLVADRIISSTAVRARATARAVAQACGFAGDVSLCHELYLAPPARHIEVLSRVQGDPASVLVVGHNPGIQQLLAALTGLDEVMPTAALAVVSLPIARWEELESSTVGTMVRLWRPRELA